MRSTLSTRMLRLVALATLASPFAMAQDRGWYGGFNIGKAKATIDDERITSSLLGAGFTTTSIADRDDHTGFKVYGGYQFSRYFALEGGYFDLGKFGFTAATLPTGTLTGDIKLTGVNLDLVLSVPLTHRFSVFGRVGVNQANAKDTFAGTGAVHVLNPSPSKRAANIKFGGGLQLDFTDSFGMRAEIERYRIDDAVGNKGHVDMASVGLLFKFGRGRTAPAEAVVAPLPPPEPVVAPPTPVVVYTPPVLVVVPAPRTQQYCSILDIQFEVNKDEMQLEEKERLAVLGAFLAKYPETTAVIEGHTDNVGTTEHNIMLSKRRAESVVAYLTGDLHIAASRLSAVGYGESRPVADNATEEGKRANRRINAVVACATDIEGLTVKPARITMALLIEYGPNKSDVQPQHRDELRKVANFLKANPTVTATVEGHTGNLQASTAQAQEISQRRAQNVVDYLVTEFGISRSRLTAEGFGRTRRFAYNTSAEGQQENRRVNVIINYPK